MVQQTCCWSIVIYGLILFRTMEYGTFNQV